MIRRRCALASPLLYWSGSEDEVGGAQANFETMAWCSSTARREREPLNDQMYTAVGMLSSFVARRSPEGEKERREVPWGMAFDMSAGVEEEDVVVAVVEEEEIAVGGDVGLVSSW